MYSKIAEKKFNELIGKKDSIILAIESSCDETAAAVVKGGRIVLSNIISSQIEIHKRFGGVVPEVASRNHTMALPFVVDEALKAANIPFDDVDAIAVTYGAGLIGALLVGVSAAKALAFALNKPLIKVNHIEAHINSNFIQFPNLQPPFLALVASGGHTSIIDVPDYNSYNLVGATLDDAIGEAFDKVARLIGLPYPGGPNVDRLAKNGNPDVKFYKAHKGVREDFNLSYSGLKTAVVNYIHNAQQKNEPINKEDICASFTKNAVDLLIDTTLAAAEKTGRKTVVLAGGVAANSYLRKNLALRAANSGLEAFFPDPILCTDNAVMVAARAYYSAFYGKNLSGLELNAVSFINFIPAQKPFSDVKVVEKCGNQTNVKIVDKFCNQTVNGGERL